MKKKFTLKDVIEYIERECELFESDLMSVADHVIVDKAKLLRKHYKRILDLLKNVK